MGWEGRAAPGDRLKWYIETFMPSLNLAKVRAPGEHFEETYSPAELQGDGDEFQIASPVSLAFDILKDQKRFRLVGHVRGSVELPCSRCAEPFVHPVEASFDLRYQPRELNTGEGDREVEEDDLSTAFYEHDTIDLALVVREQVYLSLPMKPLCEESCLGLCSQCGANLNRADCRCQREWTDPRLAELRTLQMTDQRKH
jgi:uncharacterized protein